MSKIHLYHATGVLELTGTDQQRHALSVLAATVGRHEGASAHPEFQDSFALGEPGPSQALLAFVQGRDDADTEAMLAEVVGGRGHRLAAAAPDRRTRPGRPPDLRARRGLVCRVHRPLAGPPARPVRYVAMLLPEAVADAGHWWKRGLVMALLLLLALVPVTLLQGWVLSTLWGWFIVTAFSGAPDLGIGHAIGLSLIVSALFVSSRHDDDELLEVVLRSVLQPLLALGIGFVVHLFIGGA